MIIRSRNTFLFVAVIFLAVLVTGCSSGDDVPTATNQQNNNNNSGNQGNGGSGGSGGSGSGTIDDPDGDGVDTTVEIGENTDPQDPCSYILTSQDYTITTADWRNLDCDGDGVTNGDEVDPDGNNQNDGNGTGPLDQCSLIFSRQTLEPSAEWKVLNCDNDCFLNGTEFLMGTNPTNPTLPTIGPYLSRIYRFKDFDGYLFFENEGSRLGGYTTSAFGATYSDYTYSDDKLVQVQISEADQGVLFQVDFNYNGDQIESMLRDFELFDIEYIGNEIISVAAEPFSPPGLFTTKIELDNTGQRVIRHEKYIWDNTTNYDYYVYNHQFDAEGENLVSTDVEHSRYDSSTGEYEFVEAYTQEFEYYDTILNPGKAAAQKLQIPSLLVNIRELDFSIGFSYMRNIEMTMTSTKLIRSATNSSIFTSGEYLTDQCSETEGRPRILYESPGSNGSIFNYSN